MSSRVFPIALIAVGTIWLLYAVGFVPPSLSSALVRLWPLLLVGGGLDILIPERRPRDVPFVAFAAAIILVAALFWPARAVVGREDAYERDLPPQTRQVTFELRAGSPETFVSGARSADTLVATRYTGEPRGVVNVAVNPDTRVRVTPERTAFTPFMGRARWDVEVPSSVPLHLQVDAGSGALELDLLNTRLSSLELDAGSGRARVDLPGGGSTYGVSVSGGSGALRLTVAPGASVDMEMDLGSGPTEVFIGEGSDVVLRLETGSGPVELDLPDSAPIRLTVEDDGSGPLRLPRFLERRSGSGERGVWESANLADGGRVIDIVLEDVGSGPITIR